MALQVGQIKAHPLVDSAKLFNKTTGALIGTSISCTQVGADTTKKEITFDSLATGSYTMTLFIGSAPATYDINVTLAATTWAEESSAALTDNDVKQLRYVLGLDGATLTPTAQGHFNLASFFVADVASSIIPAGPIVAQDLYDVFGQSNVVAWSDLDNNGNAGAISARQTWAINLSTSDIRSQLESSRYTWSEIETHPVIKHIIVLKAGLLLYGPRAVSDEEGKDNPMRGHRSMFEGIIKKIRAGQYSLVGCAIVDAGVPIVVDPFSTE